MPTIISDQDLSLAGFYWRTLDGVRALVCAPLEAAGFVDVRTYLQSGNVVLSAEISTAPVPGRT